MAKEPTDMNNTTTSPAATAPAAERLHVDHGGRRVRLSGHAATSEVRVHRGGMAALSAMFSRVYVQDLRQARKNGSYPTVDDPTRAAR